MTPVSKIRIPRLLSHRPYILAETETVCSCGWTPRPPKEQGCRYKKLIYCMYNKNWHRYHKNTIILQIVSLLVGISYCSQLQLILFIAGTVRSLYRHDREFEHPYFDAIIPSHLFDSNIMVAICNQTNWQIMNCHAFHRLLCHMSMWFLKNYAQAIHCTIWCHIIYQVVTSTLTSWDTYCLVIGTSADYSRTVLPEMNASPWKLFGLRHELNRQQTNTMPMYNKDT